MSGHNQIANNDFFAGLQSLTEDSGSYEPPLKNGESPNLVKE